LARACKSASARSNSWREQDANFAQAFLLQLRGEAGANPTQYRAEQLRMQRLLSKEMRRLALKMRNCAKPSCGSDAPIKR
jgi:hypothetical protein